MATVYDGTIKEDGKAIIVLSEEEWEEYKPTSKEILESVAKAVEDIRSDPWYRKQQEWAKEEKVRVVIVGIAQATGISELVISRAIKQLGVVGSAITEAVDVAVDAFGKLGKQLQKLNFPIAEMIEQKKADEREQQKVSKGYYNQLLYSMGLNHSYPVKTSSSFTNLFHRRCSMRLKTFSNLRY